MSWDREAEVSLELTEVQATALLASLEALDSDALGCLAPVLTNLRLRVNESYRPDFGDHRECACGHDYERHFDSYDRMRPIGCKYCSCAHWRVSEAEQPQVFTIEISPHEYIDAWDWGHEDALVGSCGFPFCQLPPDKHIDHHEHECEPHPEKETACRGCGRPIE